jgi:hypothetical protein
MEWMDKEDPLLLNWWMNNKVEGRWLSSNRMRNVRDVVRWRDSVVNYWVMRRFWMSKGWLVSQVVRNVMSDLLSGDEFDGLRFLIVTTVHWWAPLLLLCMMSLGCAIWQCIQIWCHLNRSCWLCINCAWCHPAELLTVHQLCMMSFGCAMAVYDVIRRGTLAY